MSSTAAILATTDPFSAYEARVQAGELTDDAAQRAVLMQLQQLHDELLRYQPPTKLAAILPDALRTPAPKGLYIHGGVGRGKSMLMDLFYEGAPVVKKRRVHFHAFMQEIHARIHDWRQQNHDNPEAKDPLLPLARALRDESWLLCLDEMEVQDVADAMILARLFSLLFKRGVVTVITSNRAPDALYAHGLQRERFLKFVALLKERITVLPLDGPRDYRLQKLQSLEQVFITASGPKAEQFLENAFASLTQHAVPMPHEMHVQGRVVLISRAGGGVAWTGFDELCAAALGAKDYITLSEQFHTLLLSGVPRLTPEKRNEARRFVTLVDELYEHRVKLLMTLETSLEDLYPEGDGSFEFQRTLSRLKEMQSASYLSMPHAVWHTGHVDT